MQSEQEMKHIHAKGAVCGSSICALLLLQEQTPPSKQVIGEQHEQNQQMPPAQTSAHVDKSLKHKQSGNGQHQCSVLQAEPASIRQPQTTLTVTLEHVGMGATHSECTLAHLSPVSAAHQTCKERTAAANVEQPQHDQLDADAHLPYKRQRLGCDVPAFHISQQQQQQPPNAVLHIPQQQEQQQARCATSEHEVHVPVNAAEIIDSIQAGLKTLRSSCTDGPFVPTLAQAQLEQLRQLPFLQQLHLYGIAATHCNSDYASDQLIAKAIDTFCTDNTAYLLQHADATHSAKLCSGAVKLFEQLKCCMRWPFRLLEAAIAQIVPAGLQPAYVLFLAGYAGPLPLCIVAASVMDYIKHELRQAGCS